MNSARKVKDVEEEELRLRSELFGGKDLKSKKSPAQTSEEVRIRSRIDDNDNQLLSDDVPNLQLDDLNITNNDEEIDFDDIESMEISFTFHETNTHKLS